MKELKPARRSQKPLDDFYVFDTETGDTLENGDVKWKLDATPKSFIFGCIFGKNYKRVIRSVREFHQEFQHPRYKGKKVFAHNAEYDLNVVFGNIYQFDNTAIFNGRFVCATNGNCTFADSLNIYKASVEDIGEKMGYPKLNLGNGDYVSKGGYSEKDIEYCFRDCEIIWFALYKIFEDSGAQKITQASLSLNLFRTRFLRFGIKHNENMTAAFWDSYFGGRCEAFFIGETNANVIDENSAYPYQMNELRFPDPAELCEENNVRINRALMLLKGYEGCMYADVFHPAHWLGHLPVKIDQKLIFPLGNLSGCWNFNELAWAIESGGVQLKKVHKVVYAPRIESPFREYVQTLYKQRFATDDLLEIERIKIFMNSLYGKLGARKKEQNIYLPDWRADIKVIKEHYDKGTFIDLVLFNGERADAFLVVKSKDELSKNGMSYSIPSYASYITSGQRVSLGKQLIACEAKGLEPVYCDTDSVFLNNCQHWDNEKQLGGWKLEDKKIKEIRGLKNYDFEYFDKKENKILRKSKIKGVPKKAKKIGDKTYGFLAMVRTKESLRRNIESGVFENKEKTLNLKYDKRKVNKDGTTKPLVLK
jgi:hypothetical protein